jgi:site-specific recombinase XerD
MQVFDYDRQVRKNREWFATYLPEAGTAIRQAPELLGLKSSKSTKICLPADI